MGVFNPMTFLFFFFFSFFLTFPFPSLFADVNIGCRKFLSSPPHVADITAVNPSPSPPPPPPPNSQVKPDFSPFKPGIAVIVGVLTTIFSVTFLLLLYAKHCKRGNGLASNANSRGVTPSAARKNSGIERAVIESLPIFRFGSLRGQKDGLECAVCLNRFEPAEVLRLLPKCKHAFHVECVDTWLDAHSTCPLCRYRVDPEDILLVGDANIPHENQATLQSSQQPQEDPGSSDTESRRSGMPPESWTRRVSGRHSSAGERATGFLQIVLHKTGESSSADGEPGPSGDQLTTSHRRSLDSSTSSSRRNHDKSENATSTRCLERPGGRKDGLLLSEGTGGDRDRDNRKSAERRLEHRIIVSGGPQFQHRWSDVHPSDLLYLGSEMIMSDSRRSSSRMTRPWGRKDGGKSVLNSRSLSEMTGLSRFSGRGSNRPPHNNNNNDSSNGEGQISRWLGLGRISSEVVRPESTAAAPTN